jgi:hypothetical protein
VFRIVDSRVSGLLEGIGMIPDIDQRELEIFSWKSLSESLSRGVEANLDNERIRIVGIDIDGFLCIEVNGREQVVSDVRSIKWSYPEI